MSALTVFLLGMGTFLGLVGRKAIELILEKEYASWAPALARLLIQVAGFVHRPRREEWLADLTYAQQVTGQSGLSQAGSCFTSCLWLSLRHSVMRGGGVVDGDVVALEHVEQQVQSWPVVAHYDRYFASSYPGDWGLGQDISLLEDTLADCERVVGPDHLHTRIARNNLASAYRLAGDLARAIPLLKATLADCERILGPDHPITQQVRRNVEAAAASHSA